MACEPQKQRGDIQDLLRVRDSSYMFGTAEYTNFIGRVLDTRVMVRLDIGPKEDYVMHVKMLAGAGSAGDFREYKITVDVHGADGMSVWEEPDPAQHKVADVDRICRHLLPGQDIDVNGPRLLRVIAYIVLMRDRATKSTHGL